MQFIEEERINKPQGKYMKRFKVLAFVAYSLIALYFFCFGLNYSVSRNVFKNASTSQIVKYPSAPISPILDEDGFYYFTSDRDFKVLQLSDLHICGSFLTNKNDNMALDAIEKIVIEEKPDLVILTGDMAYPIPFFTLSHNNKLEHNVVITLMERLGVYWTVTFGNHDNESFSFYSREEISKQYASAPHPENGGHCLFSTAKNVSGYSNSMIKIKNSQGVTTQILTLIDSKAYKIPLLYQLSSYDNIQPDQIDWYIENVKRITSENAKIMGVNENELAPVKSLAFWHVPIKEFLTAYNLYKANKKAVSGENYVYYYGELYEYDGGISTSRYEDDVFESLYEFGSTQGIFCGHDHDNNYSIAYDPVPSDDKSGIRLTYTYSIDYYTYLGIGSRGYQRGATVINISPDGSFNCQAKNLYRDYNYVDDGMLNMTPPTAK